MPVETGGIIRPLGIAEIGRAAGEGVGSHRRPDGIGQVRAGFHHDDQVAGPGDGEPEPIRPHAEAGIAGLHQRVPQRGRTTAKRRAPARGPRQVIDGRIVVTVEHSRTKAGGVTLEKRNAVPDAGDAVGDRDAGQAGAAIERPVPDAGDAVGDRDAGQAGAARERIVPDAGDAVGDRDAGQAGAVRERTVNRDAGDAVGDRVASGFAPGYWMSVVWLLLNKTPSTLL